MLIWRKIAVKIGFLGRFYSKKAEIKLEKGIFGSKILIFVQKTAISAQIYSKNLESEGKFTPESHKFCLFQTQKLQFQL